MTIDLSKAKKGDTVHFRCGGKAVVREIGRPSFRVHSDYPIGIRLEGFHADGADNWAYSTDGENAHGTGAPNSCPFDITRIESPPFDWKDVKPGMAFFVEDITYPEPQLAYFVGYDIDGHVVFDTLQIDGDIEDENFVIADREYRLKSS